MDQQLQLLHVLVIQSYSTCLIRLHLIRIITRLHHPPTGIQVVASTYRDQGQNKRQALAVLQAKLEQLAEEQREKEIAAAQGGSLDRGWGTQIRSYVFYDNRVKDHRTGVENSNYEAVLRGDIADFVDAELKRRRAEKEAARR